MITKIRNVKIWETIVYSKICEHDFGPQSNGNDQIGCNLNLSLPVQCMLPCIYSDQMNRQIPDIALFLARTAMNLTFTEPTVRTVKSIFVLMVTVWSVNWWTYSRTRLAHTLRGAQSVCQWQCDQLPSRENPPLRVGHQTKQALNSEIWVNTEHIEIHPQRRGDFIAVNIISVICMVKIPWVVLCKYNAVIGGPEMTSGH
jgi:hypothetical protein